MFSPGEELAPLPGFWEGGEPGHSGFHSVPSPGMIGQRKERGGEDFCQLNTHLNIGGVLAAGK